MSGARTSHAAPPPAGRRRAVVAVVLTIAVVVLAAGGTLVARGLRAGTLGPADVVRHYFAALERGDAGAALAYGTIPSGSRVLLTDAALRSQQAAAPISGLVVVSARTTGDRSHVRIGYQLGRDRGSTASAEVGLHRDGDVWLLDASAVPTEFVFNAAADRATFAGVAAPTGRSLMFPGAFALRFDSRYLAGTVGNDSITFGSPSSTNVDVTLTAAGRSAAVRAVRAAVTRCLTSGGLTCPQPDERYVPGSVRGRLTGGLRDVSTSLSPSPAGAVRVDARAPASVRFRRLDFVDRPHAGEGDVRLDVHALAGIASMSVRWTT